MSDFLQDLNPSRAAMSADLKAMNASFHSCITAALSTSEGGLDDSTVALLEEHAASFVASAKKVDDHFAARQRELQMDEKECLQQVGAACSRKFARQCFRPCCLQSLTRARACRCCCCCCAGNR